MIDYSLPEFVFLDGNSHSGDSLEGRTVVMHVRSNTIIDVIALHEVSDMRLECITHTFTYTNAAGATERHLLALHFTLAEEDDLPGIFNKVSSWYCNYLKWEDNNIIMDEGSKNN